MQSFIRCGRIWVLIAIVGLIVASVARIGELQGNPIPEVSTLLFVSNRDGNRDIYAMNADGTELTNLTHHPADDILSAPNPWSPDGSFIAFHSDRNSILDIYVMNMDGSDQRRVTALGNAVGYSWSPDGQRLALHSNRTISTINVDGSDLQPLTQGQDPAWSVQGKIAFVIPQRGIGATLGSIVGILNSNGTNLIPVDVDPTTAFHDSVGPRWSPGGEKLAFVNTFGCSSQCHSSIYLVNADGTNLIPLVSASEGEQASIPAWSPDGSQVAFVELGSGTIRIVNADGTNPHTVATIDTVRIGNGSLVWSPDGEWLAFEGEPSGSQASDIFIIKVDGTGLQNLTNSPNVVDQSPYWNPTLLSPPPSQPILSITPASLDFGSIVIGSSKDLDITIQNTGDGTLTGTASVSAPFSIISGNSFSLAAGQSQPVTVRFNPTSPDFFMSSATFTSNGGDASPTVSGTGSCFYSISLASQSFTANGGTGSFDVIAPSGCSWSAVTSNDWITITSGNSGNGNGTVNFSVASNPDTNFRNGAITVPGNAFTITQEGATLSSFSISGQIKSGEVGLSGVTLRLSGAVGRNSKSDELGSYAFSGLKNGSYVIIPNRNGCTFSPQKTLVSISGNNVRNVNFTASCISGTTINLDLLDPLSGSLLGASSPCMRGFPCPGAITKNIELIAQANEPSQFVQGVAADGTAQILLRFNAPQAGVVNVSIENPGLTQGALGDLEGQVVTTQILSIHTMPTSVGHKAFALYIANAGPETSKPYRIVRLRYVFVPDDTGVPTKSKFQDLKVVRPPVALVHGIWDKGTSWDKFPLPSSVACNASSNFYVCRINYHNENDKHFVEIAPIVGKRLRAIRDQYRKERHVAAIQVNVIAHSMGGNVIRTIPVCGIGDEFRDCSFPYNRADNFFQGDVNKLITIGTPHLGTPMANILFEKQEQNCSSFGFPLGNIRDLFQNNLKKPIGGAVKDLRQDSATINALNIHDPPFPIHYVVGVASQEDESVANNQLLDLVNSWCGDVFPKGGIREVFAQDESDVIVPALSQRGGLSVGARGTTDSAPDFGYVIHTSGLNTHQKFPLPGGFTLKIDIQFSSPGELELKTAPKAQPKLKELGREIIRLLDEGDFVTP